jgi:hypothetical protein
VILRSRIPVVAGCVSWRATAAFARCGSIDGASVSSEGLGRLIGRARWPQPSINVDGECGLTCQRI